MAKRHTFSIDVDNDEKAKIIQAILESINEAEKSQAKKKLKKYIPIP